MNANPLATSHTIPLILLGSNLPDLIDKPIGILAPTLGLGNGRGIAHTLAFSLALLALGVGLSIFGWAGLIYVALAAIGHLVLDYMWRLPRVLFWPLCGIAFPRVGRRCFRAQIQSWWHSLWTDPQVFVTEVAGAVFIVAYVLQVYRTWV